MARTLFTLLLGLALALPAQAASVNGLTLRSQVTGAGPALVFVHGWTCDLSSWSEQIPAFSNSYQVVSLDLPGHGDSQLVRREDFSMDLFAAAVEAVREELGAEEIVLVGHSMGVVVIRQYALNYPDRVAGLVAVDGPMDLRQLNVGGDVGAGLTGEAGMQRRRDMVEGMFVPQTSDALRDKVLTMMLETPEATAAGAAQAMFDPGVPRDVSIQAPTLGVYAGSAELPDLQAMREIVPDFEAEQVENTGHFLMLEDPAAFNVLLANFLDKIDY